MKVAGWQKVLAGALLFAAGQPASVDAAAGIRWQKSYQAAIAVARKTNKLVMVDFYTTW
jgi:thiol:disulfide interchange protein